MKIQAFFLLGLLLCACASTTEPISISKASLAMDGKADSSAVAALCKLLYGEPCDLCERQGWYGDGQCDTFCQAPDPDCGAGSCVYNGVTYQDGDGFPSSDGCNSCGCNNGDVACTERACAPEPKTCEYNGKTYQDGDGFPSTDGCNGCGCNNGVVLCTELACDPNAGSCISNGAEYPNGSTDVPDPDSCNTCSCIDGVITSCTEIHCPNPPPGQASCNYYGKEYKHGDGFDAADGCNRCGCDDGGVSCTELWCGHPDQGYACADKLCGEECTPECPADEPNCAVADVVHQCSADGACLPKSTTCG